MGGDLVDEGQFASGRGATQKDTDIRNLARPKSTRARLLPRPLRALDEGVRVAVNRQCTRAQSGL